MKSKKQQGEFGDKESAAFAGQDRLIFGVIPQPWAPRRLMAGQALGFRFFKLAPEERAQLSADSFVYDGMFWDAALCAYLCTCEPSFLFRCVRLPESGVETIMKWCDEKKLDAGTAAFDEIMNHYNTVIGAIVRSGAVERSEPGKDQGTREAVATLKGE